MANIKYIKDLSDKKGLSLREISRTTGFNFRTVQKYVDREDWSEPLTRKKNCKSVLDSFVKIIDEWLEADLNAPRKQRHTAKRVYNRLKRLYKDDFTVSYRTVARYVAEKKRQIYGSKEGFIPLYHPAGEAQLDFGMAEFVLEIIVKQSGVIILCVVFLKSFSGTACRIEGNNPFRKYFQKKCNML